jgi:ABC-type Fe3+/spermidine/putrescine transport system ATPase subunit
MAYLSLTGITKAFTSTVAVRDVSLALDRGEFFALLGPSGCGKSTLLRLIAGLEKPTAGVIALDGRDITSLAPQQRGIGLVFQNYALFPHMTVAENVGYGLEGRGLSRVDIAAKVGAMLDALRLGHRRDTPVTTLSGGEQQRVAVGRAMVVEPSVLLFDEPLSNLDVALRQETREEIRSLQRRTGITTFYVTHDQSEAMSLSDRIAVMRTGQLEQVGSPDELYNHPASEFVAEFLGGANLLSVNGEIAVPDILKSRAGEGGIVAVKPEAILISSNADIARHQALVIEREYLGFTTVFLLKVLSTMVRATAMSREIPSDVRVGQTVGITVDWSHAVAFPRR